SSEYLAEDDSTPLLATCIFFVGLETIFMGLLYTSRYFGDRKKSNWWMIILMTNGYLVCMGKLTLGILMVEIGGAGRHLATLPSHTIENTLRLQTALQIICPLTTSMTKLAVLCLFHQILGQTSRTYSLVIKTTFILVLAILIAQCLIPFINCRPFAYTWDMTLHGHCSISALVLWRYLSIPNIVTTFVLISIPLPALYKLKISRAMKVGLSLVFIVCGFGVVAAIMRFYSFLEVQDFHDITFEVVKPLCWTAAESGIYLVAGVMPMLRPLAKRV
ncbi:uncharacterized protein BDR25DRAFT_189730, partial [Lindgomyces ingoldianus]